MFDRNKINRSLFIVKDVREANKTFITVIDTTVSIKPRFLQENNIFKPIYDAPELLIFDVSTDSISLYVLIWEQHLINDAPASLIFEVSTDLILLSISIWKQHLINDAPASLILDV